MGDGNNQGQRAAKQWMLGGLSIANGPELTFVAAAMLHCNSQKADFRRARASLPASSPLYHDRPEVVHIGQSWSRRYETAELFENRKAVVHLEHAARIDAVKGRVP